MMTMETKVNNAITKKKQKKTYSYNAAISYRHHNISSMLTRCKSHQTIKTLIFRSDAYYIKISLLNKYAVILLSNIVLNFNFQSQ